MPEDLLKYGLIPEFVGRLPVVVTLSALTAEDLVRVLTEPKNAITRQFQKFLQLDKVELVFTAGRAARRGRGRRRPQDRRAGAALDRRGVAPRRDVRHPGAHRDPQMHHHRGDDPRTAGRPCCSPRPRSSAASTRRTTRSGSPNAAKPPSLGPARDAAPRRRVRRGSRWRICAKPPTPLSGLGAVGRPATRQCHPNALMAAYASGPLKSAARRMACTLARAGAYPGAGGGASQPRTARPRRWRAFATAAPHDT